VLMSYCACCSIFCRCFWGGGEEIDFFSTRYPSESYSRYDTNASIFIMVKLVLNLNYHQCQLTLLLCYVCVSAKCYLMPRLFGFKSVMFTLHSVINLFVFCW